MDSKEFLYPKISIVVPSLNQGKYIKQTITSILDQNYLNLELIIIDGGSTDETVDIIKKYSGRISYWVSEKDTGQAHAINKGLAKATGEIFNWINSDDLMEPGSLKTIADAFAKDPGLNVLCGTTRCFYTEDNSTSHEYRMGVRATVAETITKLEMNQPGSFYRMAVVRAVGGINESLRYVFDDELWFRYVCKYGLSNITLSVKRFAEFRLHGTSKSVGEGFESFQKEIHILHIDLLNAAGAPAWLIEVMKKQAQPVAYKNAGEWDLKFLEKEKFIAAFAVKYINTLYLSGEKRAAKQAMRMAVQNGYFKFNRMLTSLRLKLLFS